MATTAEDVLVIKLVGCLNELCFCERWRSQFLALGLSLVATSSHMLLEILLLDVGQLLPFKDQVRAGDGYDHNCTPT